MSTIHEDYIYRIVSQRDAQGRVKSRERNNLEYKESFGLSSWAKYAKTMAAFANNQGGYILFGIKDSPREVKGVNAAFGGFKQEKFTESLNSLFSPEIIWECGTVDVDGVMIGFRLGTGSSERAAGQIHERGHSGYREHRNLVQ